MISMCLNGEGSAQLPSTENQFVRVCVTSRMLLENVSKIF